MSSIRPIQRPSARAHGTPTLGRAEIVWERASGSIVYDANGKDYIDFSSGVLVANTGHCHPRVVEAIQAQAGKLLTCYDSPHPLRTELEGRLAALMPNGLKRVQLLTTGAEAVEAAIRTARRVTGRSHVIGFEGAFHGRTYMAMSVGGLGSVKEGYGPLVGDVIHSPFPYAYRCEGFGKEAEHDCSIHCLAALRRTIESDLDGPVAAIVLEPYQGAGGSLVAPATFVQGIRRLCDELGAVMIVDEIQSSFGRTGTMFAFEQWSVQPDVLIVAKGIASGVPTSAIMMRDDLYESMPIGSLSSTFGGNPLSCAAALATLDVIHDEDLPARARTLGEMAMASLRSAKEMNPLIGDIRGMGLAIGIELVLDRESKEPAVAEAQAVVHRAIAGGLVVLNPIGIHHNVIRVGPPLTTSEAELARGLDILRTALQAVGDSRDRTAADHRRPPKRSLEWRSPL